jgi:hypothetical protein
MPACSEGWPRHRPYRQRDPEVTADLLERPDRASAGGGISAMWTGPDAPPSPLELRTELVMTMRPIARTTMLTSVALISDHTTEQNQVWTGSQLVSMRFR